MQLAGWVDRTPPSFIREILKVANQPGIISFAGGLPAPELFPVTELAAAFAAVLAARGSEVLQYSPSEGNPRLRAVLADYLSSRGTPARAQDILLTNGSQHGLDLVAKALLDPGDTVLVEDPTYLGALQAFLPYRPRLAPVAADAQGMRPDALAASLRAERPKLIYLMPTFQNPRGACMDRRRRLQLTAIARSAGVTVLEDDPYGELRYRGQHLPGLRHFWDQVVYLGSFSKTMAPGLRLGWIVAPPSLLPALKLGLQATCLNVSALTQAVAAAVLAGNGYHAHLQGLRQAYAERLEAMLAALQRYFPPGAVWNRPQGGLFVWVTLPPGLQALDLVDPALAEGVAFVPGAPFYVGSGGAGAMRLNFSNAPPALIETGVQRLARAIDRLAGRATGA